MTTPRPQSGDIPSPQPSVLTQPFWDACERGSLVFLRCEDCGGASHAGAMLCAHCCSRGLEWRESSGTGSVYSWSTVWRPQSPEFATPYIAAIVNLDEGWSMISNIIDCDPEQVSIDMRVEVEFHPINDGTVLPLFRPVDVE